MGLPSTPSENTQPMNPLITTWPVDCAMVGAVAASISTAIVRAIRFDMMIGPQREAVPGAAPVPLRATAWVLLLDWWCVWVAAERVGDLRNRALRADAVASVIERWRDDGDAELAWRHRDDASADTALGGEPRVIEPFPRVVVESSGRHHCEHARDLVRVHHLFAGDRISATGRQCCGHGGEVPRVHADRALLRVEIDRLLPVVLDVAVRQHQRADRLIALIGVRLRLVDVLQHVQGTAGEVVVDADDLLPHLI